MQVSRPVAAWSTPVSAIGSRNYEFRGKLQIQLLCGADDNARGRMNTGRYELRDPSLALVAPIGNRRLDISA